jgi:RNA recognition motif-containing protein
VTKIMAKKLFVGGLSWDTTDSTLNAFFSKVGNVVSATVITDKYSGRSKGFGFVEMSTEEEAQKAQQELNGQSLDGRNINISEARPMQPRDNNFHGGNSSGRRDNWKNDRRDRDNRRGGGGGRY